jgi:hypothetical protein
VSRHIPRAWSLATPEKVITARFEGVDAALRRLLGEDVIASPEVSEAAELARAASDGCTPEGRPLYAVHADLQWPAEPHLVLWHAITLLREFRGDGHIAALVAGGLSGLGALITHTATGKGFLVPAAKATRGWSHEQWNAELASLGERDIVDERGELTSGARGCVTRSRTRPIAPRWLRGSTSAPRRLTGCTTSVGS